MDKKWWEMIGDGDGVGRVFWSILYVFDYCLVVY